MTRDGFMTGDGYYVWLGYDPVDFVLGEPRSKGVLAFLFGLRVLDATVCLL